MKGTILGFDAAEASGVLKGEDGKRYPFTATEWKNQRSPRAGDEVDFEAGDDTARAIYLLRGASLPLGDVGAKVRETLSGTGVDLSAANSRAKDVLASGVVQKFLGLLTTRLAFGVAIAILVASFFLSYLKTYSSPILTQHYSIADLDDSIAVMQAPLHGQAAALPSQLQNPSQAQSASDLDVWFMLMRTAYLIPALAALSLIFEWLGRPSSLLNKCLGITTLLSVAVIYVVHYGVVEFYAHSIFGNLLTDDVRDLTGPHPAFGAYFIACCGIVLLLNVPGIVRLRNAGNG